MFPGCLVSYKTNYSEEMVSKIDAALRALEEGGLYVSPFSGLNSRNAVAARMQLAARYQVRK